MIHRRIIARRTVRAVRLLAFGLAAAAVLLLAHMEYQDARADVVGAAAYFE